MKRCVGTVAATMAVGLGLGVVTGSAAAQERQPPRSGPMSILYADQRDVVALTSPSGPGRPLSGARGAVRQDPGVGGMLDPAGRDADHRISKVSDHDLVDLSAVEIADHIQRESDSPRIANTTGIVAIDEVGNPFNDGRVTTTYRWVNVRGKRIRVASHNRVVITPNGWRLVRGSAALPSLKPESLGARLSEAMRILASRAHPAGGTYADRVHIYVAPAFSTSIAGGRGPHRHLGNDGKPHRATWRGVMPALASAGGVWLQMYHYSGRSLGTMSAKTWRTVPTSFTAYGARFGLRRDRVHFMFGGATRIPVGAPRGCGDAMACQWVLAGATPAGRAVLANGPGAYRTGSLSTSWREQYNRVFTG